MVGLNTQHERKIERGVIRMAKQSRVKTNQRKWYSTKRITKTQRRRTRSKEVLLMKRLALERKNLDKSLGNKQYDVMDLFILLQRLQIITHLNHMLLKYTYPCSHTRYKLIRYNSTYMLRQSLNHRNQYHDKQYQMYEHNTPNWHTILGPLWLGLNRAITLLAR